MSELSIKIEGLPETIQCIADALEEAFPGQIAWAQSEEYAGEVMIAIEGYGMPSMHLQRRRNIAA